LVAFSVLDDVFVAKRLILACTGYVALILTFFFATLLHFTEKDNDIAVGHLTMGDRYKDVPSALFFTTLHLSGDYPLYQYTFWGKVINFFIILVGVGLVGIPSGIIVGGFEEIMMLLKQKQQTEGEGEGESEELRVELGSDDVRCQICRVAKAQTEREQVHVFLMGDTFAGRLFRYLVCTAVIGSVAGLIVSTSKSWAAYVGGANGWALASLEVVSVAILTLDYALRIYSVPEDSDYASRSDYLTSFLSCIDLLSIAPFYISLFLDPSSTAFMVMSSLRVVRLLKMEHYFESVTLIDNIVLRAKHVLVASTLVAFLIWIVCATLLYITECDNERLDGAFDTIPKSMFFTILFLGGEWAMTDFTPVGKCIGVVIVLLGIGMFAVPTGILFSAFEDMLETNKQLLEDRRKAAACVDCGGEVTSFRHHRTMDEGQKHVARLSV
jgi:voltage-gated potassium channel